MCQCSSAAELLRLGEQAVTLERMQMAVRVLLRELGEDVTREGLVDTPRVSAAGGGLAAHCA
jgi:GTP cyclohydrolase I